MPETRRKYDREFREGAVRLVRETGKPIAQVARDLGINPGTLGNWVNADKRRRGEGNGALSEDAFGAGPALAFQIFHSATSHVLDATPDEAAQWCLDMLAEAIGGPCPAPTAVAVS